MFKQLTTALSSYAQAYAQMIQIAIPSNKLAPRSEWFTGNMRDLRN